jgi:putative CocE/NonD family hydrolase
MRDGVILRADVFRPDGGGPFPALVLRTPYGKQGKKFDAYVNAGYIVVCQDARGRYESEGQWESFYRKKMHDAEDGYDTVEWAAKLPGCNGKVGTFGVSYNSFLQWKLAPLRPPSLIAMAASSIPARLSQLEGPGAIRPGRRLNWFYCGMAPDMRLRSGAPGPQTKAEAQKLWKEGEAERLLRFLPRLDLPDSVFENEAEAVKEWLRHPEVETFDFAESVAEIAVPNLDIVGWFDHCNDSIELDTALMAKGRTAAARQTRLIIGPWSHSSRGKRKQGEVDFGPEAAVDLAKLEVRWFDHWLKGIDNGVTKDAPVRIFIMGANRWRDEMEWPLKRAVTTTLHLGSGGLLAEAVRAAGTDHYRYDPADPVPTLWTPAMFTVPADQRPLAGRRDILTYQTAPLAEALEVTGYPEVILHAASSAPDTDFFARLIDVAPDGSSVDVAMGMVRTRYRHGLKDPKLAQPGEVVELRIRLRPTSNEFQAGHRLRLDITSSDFPNYDINPNTAAPPNTEGKPQVAEQTIHHGGGRASRLMLPVIPRQ